MVVKVRIRDKYSWKGQSEARLGTDEELKDFKLESPKSKVSYGFFFFDMYPLAFFDFFD